MKNCFVLAGLAAAVVLLNGCGGEGESTEAVDSRAAASKIAEASKGSPPPEGPPRPQCPTPSQGMRVTLDGPMGAENVGILTAKKRGYFGDVGLHVLVVSPVGPEYPVDYVSAGVSDIGMAPQPQVVLAQAVGERIVAVGSVISEPTAAMIWLQGSGIRDIADLEGKTVAVPGVHFQEDFLEEVLARAGLTLEDVVVKQAHYKSAADLLEGRADAIFGGTWNIEGAALKAQGAEPVITPVQDLGIPAYDELVVIARPDCAAKYPQMIRHFMAAVARGTAAAVKDPQGTMQLIEESHVFGRKEGPKETKAQVEATLHLLSRDGQMDQTQATELIAWMHDEGMIEQEPPAAQLFSNAYLAR